MVFCRPNGATFSHVWSFGRLAPLLDTPSDHGDTVVTRSRLVRGGHHAHPVVSQVPRPRNERATPAGEPARGAKPAQRTGGGAQTPHPALSRRAALPQWRRHRGQRQRPCHPCRQPAATTPWRKRCHGRASHRRGAAATAWPPRASAPNAVTPKPRQQPNRGPRASPPRPPISPPRPPPPPQKRRLQPSPHGLTPPRIVHGSPPPGDRRPSSGASPASA